MNRELYADLLEAILRYDDDEIILNLLSVLSLEELQDLSLTASTLSQLCRMAAENLPAPAVAGEGER